MDKQEIQIQDSYDGVRFDRFLLEQFQGARRSEVYKLLRMKAIRLNGAKADPAARLTSGDLVEIRSKAFWDKKEEKQGPKPVKPTFGVLYEDDNVLFVNKRAGIAVHGGTGVKGHTLIAELRGYLPDMKPSLIHRLDKDTSGVLLVGKHRQSTLELSKLLRGRRVTKRYRCFVWGRVPDDSGALAHTLQREARSNASDKIHVAEEGQDARLHYAVLQRYEHPELGSITELLVTLETGRMHQIRVQFAAFGFPLIGDSRYGLFEKNREVRKVLGVKRLMLHSNTLGLELPTTTTYKEVEAPLPHDMISLHTSLAPYAKD